MRLRLWLPLCAVLAACGNDPTSVLLRIGAAPAGVSSLSATIWVDGRDVGAPQPLSGGGPVTLPGTAIVRLDAAANVLLHVQLDATLDTGEGATAIGAVQTRPHAQVPLDLTFGTSMLGDGGVGDGGGDGGDGGVMGDMASTDMATHVIASDTFFRPNQVFWGTASDNHMWVGDANTAAPPFAIAAHTGFLTMGGAGVSYSAVLGPSAADADVLVLGNLDTTDQSCNFGPVARFVDGNNFYKVYVDGISLVLQKQVGGVKTVLGSVIHPILPSTNYNLRLQVQGTTLRGRVWEDGMGEPTTWDVTATDATFTAGQTGIRALIPGNAQIHVKSFQAMGN